MDQGNHSWIPKFCREEIKIWAAAQEWNPSDGDNLLSENFNNPPISAYLLTL
jgi:hypothetical protein